MAAKPQIALVTGANKGIGRSAAISLARDHGYTVLIGSRSLAAGEAVASELRSQGHDATALQLDLHSDDSIAAAVKLIGDKYGRLDVLVNNAGIFIDARNANVPKLPTRELFTQTFATNVVGAACLTDALLPLLNKAVGGPRVVFVSTSMSSLARITDKNVPYYHLNATAYNSSKAALNMLALSYVRILDPVGGRVRIACPGLVNTDLTQFAYPGAKTADQGAEHLVKLATDESGRNGTFSSSEEEVIPW
jgi:NAD(P)-dependent dehydrogenase (short-subunit alcohol dehydrogenase family)